MADITAADVTYSVEDQQIISGSGYNRNRVSVAFGDGVDTYPTGGVPLTKANLGLPTTIRSLEMTDAGSANGFVYKYDDSAEKIRIYQGDNDNVADAPLIELAGGVATPAAATLLIVAEGY